MRIAGGKLEVIVDGKSIVQVEDDRPLPAGTIGLRQWQRPARYRGLWVKPSDGARTDLPFEPPAANAVVISRVFEFNANNHDHRRALANAAAIGQITRDGRVPVALSANCLQPDGQNDNGWDQGLLFLNPAKMWLQPPGYVTKMVSRSYQPRVLDTRVEGAGAGLDVTATASEDGRQLVLHVVNVGAEARPVNIRLDGFSPASPVAKVEQRAASLRATNTADEPDRVAPRSTDWRHGMKDGAAACEFPPHSFTVIRFQ